MADKRNRDAGKTAEDAVEQSPGGAKTSRRRFTRGGVAASAILTLSSRSAFANRCTVSAMSSMNMSIPNGVTCLGNTAEFYQDPLTWQNAFDPGLPNPLVVLNPALNPYEISPFSELDAVSKDTTQSSDLRMMVDLYIAYWWPNGNAMAPQPNSPPTYLDGVLPFDPQPDPTFGAAGRLTLMQALQFFPNELHGQAAAGLLNASLLDVEQFGYDPDQFRAFLTTPNPDLLDDLKLLNGVRS